MKRPNVLIGIYDRSDSDLLVNIVDTVEDAATWLGCNTTTLYKSMRVHGVMQYQGYYIDIIEEV